MIQTYAPVAVFAYNRADKLENCINNLEKCPEAADTDLFIFCDGAKGEKDRGAVGRVHDRARAYCDKSPFKSVTVRAQDTNRGLAASIISGVTEVIDDRGKIIVVEDDLVVRPSFLRYMNEGLQFYRDEPKCGSVCGFSYPMKSLSDYDKDVYFTRKGDCWGWATWSDRWNKAAWADTDFESYLSDSKLRRDFESLEAGLDRLMYLQYKGMIDSWAVRWVYYLFTKGQLSVYPTVSRVVNDGFDGSGTHISGGFGKGFNCKEGDEGGSIDWEPCILNEKLARDCAVYPRRFFPLYVLETIRFMMKKK